jgi:hypothetical protein
MLFPEARLPRTVREAFGHMVAALGPDEKELIRTVDLENEDGMPVGHFRYAMIWLPQGPWRQIG